MGGTKYKYNTDFFKKIDSEEKAYWLGFLYADGSITRFYKKDGEVRSMSVELSLKTEDREHLEKYINSLESNVPIQTRKHKLKDKIYESNRVVINNTKFARNLIDKGCTPNKGLTLTFPSEEILPKELIPHFIRGYFDGDGCVHYSESMHYYKNKGKEYLQKTFIVSIVGTYDMLNSIKNILIENEIKSSEINHGNCGKAYELRIHDRYNIKNLYNYLYDNSSISLNRKKDKFLYAFKQFNIA